MNWKLGVVFLIKTSCRSYIYFHGGWSTRKFNSRGSDMSLVCTRMSSVFHSYVLACHPYVTLMSSICHSYVLLCHPYVTRMYSYAIRMSLVCHSYAFVCYPYVTRMYSYVIRMSLVCGFTMNLYFHILERNFMKKYKIKLNYL